MTSGSGYTINAGSSLWMQAASLDLDQVTLTADSIYVNANGSRLTVDDVTAFNGSLNLLATSALTAKGKIQALAGDILLDANIVTMEANASLNTAGSVAVNGTNQISLSEVIALSGTLAVNGGTTGINLHGLTVNNLLVNSDSSPLVDVTIGDVIVNNQAIVKSQTLELTMLFQVEHLI